MKILVVDDDRFLGDFVTRELRERGHDATFVHTAAQALATAMQERFDLLLCDLVMPGINGVHVVRSISQRLPNLPIIVLSSLDPGKWEPICLEAGAARYLQKPTSVDDLVEEVKNVERNRLQLYIGLIDFDPEHRTRLQRDLELQGCQVRSWASLPEMVRSMPHGPSGLTLVLVDSTTRDVITTMGWAKEYGVPTVTFGPKGSFQEENMLRLGASLCVLKPVNAEALITQARFLVG